MRAALYARVSTEMQEKEQTIQSQIAVLAQYAVAHGLHTTPALRYLDDGYSGTHLDRPALDALRDHAREGRFDLVVVLCPDRLARKYAYHVLLLEELKRAGVDVHFCERPISESPDDQLLLQIQGAIAEYERTKIIERSRRGRLHRARLGELAPARPPYGYRRTAKRHGGDGQIQVDETEAALVRQVYAWYAEEGMTLYRLLGRLNASVWTTRSGRKEWAATTVLRMLRCDWYLGRAYYHCTRSTRNPRAATSAPYPAPPQTTVVARPRADWIAVPVPPLIEESLARVVRQRLTDNRRFSRRRRKVEGVCLLQGLLRCGHCGHAYIGETRVDRRADGREYRYHYYLCHMRATPLANGSRTRCPNERLHVAGVNETVWTAVRDLLCDSDTVTQKLRAWVATSSTTPPDAAVRVQRAQTRLIDLAQQRDRLTLAYQVGALSLEVFRPRMQGLEEQRLTADQALLELTAVQLQGEVAQARADGAEQVVRALGPQLDRADFATRQLLLRLLVERVIITGQRLEIQLAIPVSSNFGLTSEGHQRRHAPETRQHPHMRAEPVRQRLRPRRLDVE
jgi:site-specific DNA recombinase